jgi:hypothetical protein
MGINENINVPSTRIRLPHFSQQTTRDFVPIIFNAEIFATQEGHFISDTQSFASQEFLQ